MSNAKSPLPTALTSYDLLKTFAVLIMVIDHLGAYIFPDELWLRAIGRIGFPVWFFLVGYARGRDLPAKLMIGAGILIVANLIVGMPIFPLNALVTIALIRISIDPVMKILMKGRKDLWMGSFVLFLIALPTGFFTEYGTQALITAIYGYYVRHKRDVADKDVVGHYMIFAYVTFILIQLASFGFTFEQMMVMGVGTLFVRGVLYFFEARSFPTLTQKLPSLAVGFTQLCGRRTLEIYVVHLLLFKLWGAYWGLEGFGWFDFETSLPFLFVT